MQDILLNIVNIAASVITGLLGTSGTNQPATVTTTVTPTPQSSCVAQVEVNPNSGYHPPGEKFETKILADIGDKKLAFAVITFDYDPTLIQLDPNIARENRDENGNLTSRYIPAIDRYGNRQFEFDRELDPGFTIITEYINEKQIVVTTSCEMTFDQNPQTGEQAAFCIDNDGDGNVGVGGDGRKILLATIPLQVKPDAVGIDQLTLLGQSASCSQDANDQLIEDTGGSISEGENILGQVQTATYTTVEPTSTPTLTPTFTPTNTPTPTPTLSPFGEQKTLIIAFNFQDNPNNRPFTLDMIRNVMFGSTNSVDDYYRKNSFSKTWFTGDVVGWYTLPYDSNPCPVSGPRADALARQNGINVTAYARHVYIFPRNTSCGPSAGWGGGGNEVYINGVLELRTLAHEFGHNFGLGHADYLDCGTKAIDKYSNCMVRSGDPYTTMGYSPGGINFHHHAFFKTLAGWIPTDNIQEVTEDGIYTITPLESANQSIQTIKIRKPDTNEYYYLEYRQPLDYDENLPTAITEGVLIHIGVKENTLNDSYLIDTTPKSIPLFPTTVPPSPGVTPPPEILRGDLSDAALSDGSSFYDQINKLAIRQISHDQNGVTISVRFNVEPLPAPEISLVQINPNSATLHWQPISGAESYFFQISDSSEETTDGGYSCTLGAGSSSNVCAGSENVQGEPTTNGWTNATSVSITNLKCNTPYYAHAKASGSGNNSPWSEDFAATTAPCPTNTLTPTPTPTVSGFGNAAVFSAEDNSYVYVKNSHNIGPFDNVTIEALVKYEEREETLGYPIISKKLGETVPYLLEITPKGKLHLIYSIFYRSRWAPTEITSNTTIEPGKWTHVAVVYNTVPLSIDEGKISLYINGVRDTEDYVYRDESNQIGGGSDQYGRNILIGTDPSFSYYFNGQIDEVRISNTPKYLGEWLRYSGPHSVESDTLMLFHFNETSGDPTGLSVSGPLETTSNNITYVPNPISGITPAPTRTPTPTNKPIPTVTPTPTPAGEQCPPPGMPNWVNYYGYVTTYGSPASIGAPVRAYSPRGELVGCQETKADSAGQTLYPFMRIYGSVPSEGFSGMQPGEPVTFKVDNQEAVATSLDPDWKNEYSNTTTNVNLFLGNVPSINNFHGKIAYSARDGGYDYIYTMNADGTQVTRISPDATESLKSNFSPSGAEIVFLSNYINGNHGIFKMNNDGSNIKHLTDYDTVTAPKFSPDGTKIIFDSNRYASIQQPQKSNIYIIEADGSSQPQQIIDTRNSFGNGEPSFSPDGSKIVFSADRDTDHNSDIYVMNTDGSSLRNLTSTSDSIESSPSYLSDGRIVYIRRARRNSILKQFYLMNPDGSGKSLLLTIPIPYNSDSYSIDAGGKYILFTSDYPDKVKKLYVLDIDNKQLFLLPQDSLPKTSYSGLSWVAKAPPPLAIMDSPTISCPAQGSNTVTLSWQPMEGAINYLIQAWDDTGQWYKNEWVGNVTQTSFSLPSTRVIFARIAWTNDPDYQNISDYSQTTQKLCEVVQPTATPTATPRHIPSPTATPTPIPPCVAENNVIHLTPYTSPGTCHDLQTAVDAVNEEGYTIKIAPGQYPISTADYGYTLKIENKRNLTIEGDRQQGSKAVKLVTSSNQDKIQIENSSGELGWMQILARTDNYLITIKNSQNFRLAFAHVQNDGSNAIGIVNSSNISIVNSEIKSAATGINMANARNVIIANNTLKNWINGIGATDSSASVRFNLIDASMRSGQWAIFLNKSNNFEIDHNTIIGHTKASAGAITHNPSNDPFSSQLIIRNNIIAFNHGGIGLGSANKISYTIERNDLFGNDIEFYGSKGQNYYGIPDQTGINGNIAADPLFGEGECLQSGSPALYGDVSQGEFMGHRGPCQILPTPTSSLLPTPTPTATPIPVITGLPGVIVFERGRYDGSQKPQIYLMNADLSSWKNLTSAEAYDMEPNFSRNGTKIVFASNRNGYRKIYKMNNDGSQVEQLTTDTSNEETPQFSPDGKHIIFVSDRDFSGGNRGNEIYIMNADGTNQRRLTSSSQFNYNNTPTFSPDGRNIVFSRYNNGFVNIFLINVDGTRLTQLTNEQAVNTNPIFTPDGEKIIYIHDGHLYRMNPDGQDQTKLASLSVPVRQGLSFSTDGTKILFTGQVGTDIKLYVFDTQTGQFGFLPQPEINNSNIVNKTYPGNSWVSKTPPPLSIPDPPQISCQGYNPATNENTALVQWTGYPGSINYYIQAWDNTNKWYRNEWVGNIRSINIQVPNNRTIFSRIAWTNDPNYQNISDYSETAQKLCETVQPTATLTVIPTNTPIPTITPTATPRYTPTPTATPTLAPDSIRGTITSNRPLEQLMVYSIALDSDLQNMTSSQAVAQKENKENTAKIRTTLKSKAKRLGAKSTQAKKIQSPRLSAQTADTYTYHYELSGLDQTTSYLVWAEVLRERVTYLNQPEDCNDSSPILPGICFVQPGGQQNFTIKIPTGDADISGNLAVNNPAAISIAAMSVPLCEISPEDEINCLSYYDFINPDFGINNPQGGRYKFPGLTPNQEYLISAIALTDELDIIFNPATDCREPISNEVGLCQVIASGTQDLSLSISTGLTPTLTATPIPTSTPTLTPTPSPTNTPAPTPTQEPGKGNFSFIVKLQGMTARSQHKPEKLMKVKLLRGPGAEAEKFETLARWNEEKEAYQGTVYNIRPGNYHVFIKGPSHLQRYFETVVLNPDETTMMDYSDTSLLFGDVYGEEGDENEYNKIKMSDITAVISAISQSDTPVTAETEKYDYDGSGFISLNDITAIIANLTTSELKGDDESILSPEPTETPTPTPTEELTPTQTPTPTALPGVYLNSASAKSCDQLCSEESMSCLSVGLNPQGTDDSRFTYFSDPNNPDQNHCDIERTASCSTVMEDKETVCGDYQADWTYCRCDLSPTVTETPPTATVNPPTDTPSPTITITPTTIETASPTPTEEPDI